MFILRDFRHRQNIVLAQLVSATGAAIFHELMDRQNKEPKLQNANFPLNSYNVCLYGNSHFRILAIRSVSPLAHEIWLRQ